MGRPAQRLELEGVRLRRWRPADADVLHAAVAESLDHLSPWLAWARAGYTRADAVELLVRGERDWASGQAYHYAIVAPDGAVVGSCGLMSRPGEGLEIGYWLHPGYTGRGIATRAAAAVAAEAFRVGAGWVQIKHDEANVRSGRVPARLGFTRVARCPALEPVTAAGDSGTDLVWRLDRPAVTGRRQP